MKKYLVLISIMLSWCFSLTAQDVNRRTIFKEIELRKYALEFLDEYAANTEYSFTEDSEILRNMLLYPDSAIIPNDILPANALFNVLSYSEYDEMHYSFYDPKFQPSIKVRPYRIEVGQLDSLGYATYSIDLDKMIYARSKQNNYYLDTIDLHFNLQFNWNDTTNKIISISLNKDQGKYLWIDANNEKDQALWINGDPINYDSKGRYLHKDAFDGDTIILTAENDNFYAIDPIVVDYKRIGADDENKSNTYFLKKKRKTFFIQSNPGISFGGESFNFSNETQASVQLNYTGLHVGSDIGLQVVGTKKLRVAIIGGIQQSIWFYNGKVEGDRFYYENQLDIDSDVYDKILDIENYREFGRKSITALPVQMRFDIQIAPPFELFISGGMSYSILGGIRTNYDAVYEVSGKYGPEYYNVVLQNLPEYGFDTYYGSSRNYKLTDGFNTVFGRIGAVYKLNDILYPHFSIGFSQSNSQFIGTSSNLVSEENNSGIISNNLNSVFSSPNQKFRAILLSIGIKRYL
jgi:hypothetical protein